MLTLNGSLRLINKDKFVSVPDYFQSRDRLQRQAEATRATLKHLEQVEDVLDEARSEFEHELRRAGDALVRSGGRSWRVENRIKELKGNIALNRKDLDENTKRRRELETHLRSIEDELGRN